MASSTDRQTHPQAGAEPKPPPKSARRRSREFALQGLYQWLQSGDSGAVIEQYIAQTPAFNKADHDHFRALLRGVIREVESLHAAIVPHIDRALRELSPVEHSILLIAVFEFTHHPEIPYRVVINEAVELAKTFGGTDGYKYVNGVLDRAAALLRPAEAPARR